MYLVVSKKILGKDAGAITWSDYQSKEFFDKEREEYMLDPSLKHLKVKEVYEPLFFNVESGEKAIEICRNGGRLLKYFETKFGPVVAFSEEEALDGLKTYFNERYYAYPVDIFEVPFEPSPFRLVLNFNGEWNFTEFQYMKENRS